MRHLPCKCGKKYVLTSGMPLYDCQGCEECGTTYAKVKIEAGDAKFYFDPLIPHDFSVVKFNQNTGKPYNKCRRCGAVDHDSYLKSMKHE